MKRLLITIALAGILLTPAASSSAAPCERACWAWRNTCTKYVYVFGRPICTRWTLTCIQWL